MTSAERHNKAIELFHRACDLPHSARSSFLADACGADSGLRHKVESLLRHDAEVDDAVEAAEAGEGIRALSAIAVGADTPIPSRIGRYRIERKIGQGGMGVVYKARQDHPRRTVALKVLHAGLGTAGALKRFHREADHLGRLQHAAIAQVYEAGVGEVEMESGATGKQPFFAMELIDGRPLDRFAQEQDLDDRARLELFAEVCDGVQHAHDRGVVHRDLKPGNILVTLAGRPKILDFGVSRATDAGINTVTLRTDAGQLVGTIPYMSPEQVTGDPAALDERSDVYALGVLLFELLAGRLPYELRHTPIPEAVRVIRDDEPTLLGSVDRRLRGELEIIVSKALEKVKDRRYQSAAELGADVRRFLRDEPLVARPASTIYQLLKFTRRHKGLVGGITATILALVLGLCAATYGLLNANREREISVAVTAFLAEALAAANPENQGRNVTVREVMDRAADDIGDRFAAQPLVEAKLRNTVGKTYVSLSEYDRAERQISKAVEIWDRAVGKDHIEAIDARANLGEVLYFLGRYEEAEREFVLVQKRYQRVLNPGDPRLLSSAADVAFINMQLGRLADAERLFLEAASIRKRTLDADDPIALELRSNLASLYIRMNKLEKAEATYVDVIERSRRVRGAEHPETIQAISNLASTYLFGGRFRDAIPLLKSALESQARLLGESHSRTLITLHNLGVAFQRIGQYSESESILREGLARARTAFGEEYRITILFVESLGRNCWTTGKHEEAEPLLTDAVRLNRVVFGNDGLQALLAQDRLVSFYVDLKHFNKALPLADDLIQYVDPSKPHAFPQATTWKVHLAQVFTGLRRFADAERLLNEAHYQARVQDEHLTVTALAELYDEWGRPDEAERWRSELPADETDKSKD